MHICSTFLGRFYIMKTAVGINYVVGKKEIVSFMFIFVSCYPKLVCKH